MDVEPSYKQQLLFSISLQYQMAVGYDHWNIILGDTDNPNDTLGLLILGALPIKNTVYIPSNVFLSTKNHDQELIKLCNDKNKPLKIIISAIQDFEKAGNYTLLDPIKTLDWQKNNIKQLHVKIPDNGFNLPYEELGIIIDEIDKAILRGESCYVHCKAGRGRSWTIIMAYLLKYTEYNSVGEAQAYVKSKRDQVSPSQQQLDYIKGFEQYLVVGNESSATLSECAKIKINCFEV